MTGIMTLEETKVEATVDDFMKKWVEELSTPLTESNRVQFFSGHPNTIRRPNIDKVTGLEVELSASGRNNHTVRINSLFSNNHKSGEASEFLKWLVSMAELHDFSISACVQPFGWNLDKLPNKDKLREWFERFGFQVSYEYPDELGYEMIRTVGSVHSKKKNTKNKNG